VAHRSMRMNFWRSDVPNSMHAGGEALA